MTPMEMILLQKKNNGWLFSQGSSIKYVRKNFRKLTFITPWYARKLRVEVFEGEIRFIFLFLYFKSNHRRCFIEKVFVKNFVKFTGKLLCQNLFKITLLERDCLFFFWWLISDYLICKFSKRFILWPTEWRSYEKFSICPFFCLHVMPGVFLYLS